MIQPFATYFPGTKSEQATPLPLPRDSLPPPTPRRDLGVGTGGVGFGVSPTYQVMGGAYENMHCSMSILMSYNIK